MIVIKIELHSAITKRVTLLGKMHICNDGTSKDPKIGHYLGGIFRNGSDKTFIRRGSVEGWRRKDRTVWELLFAMLKSMDYK